MTSQCFIFSCFVKLCNLLSKSSKQKFCSWIIVKVKFKYSEKATNFCEISTIDLFVLCSNSQIYSGDFAKFCGLLRIYELYLHFPDESGIT